MRSFSGASSGIPLARSRLTGTTVFLFVSFRLLQRKDLRPQLTRAEPRQGSALWWVLISQQLCIIKEMITEVIISFMGRVVGFEPTHIGTTIRGLNRLTTSAINHQTQYTKSSF